MGHRAESNLAQAIEATGDLSWSVDLDYGLICFNRAAQQRFELNPGVQAAKGMRPLDILPPEQAALWHLMYGRTIEEGPFRVEYEITAGRLLEIFFSPILVDGRAVGVSVLAKDITERKVAEAARLEADFRYRAMVEGALEGMFQISLNSTILNANSALARILGFDTVEEAKATLSSIAEKVWTDEDEHTTFMRRLAEEKEVKGFECRLRRKDGTVFWASVSSRGIYGHDEKLLYFEGFLEDITVRKQAEQRLAERENRLRRIFEQNGSIMLLVDPDSGEITDANPAAATFYGYAQEKLIGMNVEQINSLPAQEVALERQSALLEQRKYFNFRHRRASGEERDVEVYGACQRL